MKNQTLSIEQMKHLKDLGVDVSKASMCWWLPMERLRSEGGYFLDAYEPHVHEQMSDDPIIMAFTLQDMLEMMPKEIIANGVGYTLCINPVLAAYINVYLGEIRYTIFETAHYGDFLKGAYDMLCWLAENGHLKGGKP